MYLFSPQLTKRDGPNYTRLSEAHGQTQGNRNYVFSVSTARRCQPEKKFYPQLNTVKSVYITIDATNPRLAAKSFCRLPLGTSDQEFPVSFPFAPTVVQFLWEHRAGTTAGVTHQERDLPS